MNGRLELSALFDAPKANDDGCGVLRRCGVERRSALWTENLRTAIAALCDLDVAFRFTAKLEAREGRCDHGPKRGA